MGDSASLASGNPHWFIQIARARQAGRTCLPWQLGLDSPDYRQLASRHALPLPSEAELAADLREELLGLRRDEWAEIRNLLLEGQPQPEPEHHWMAAIVAAGCLGGDHLWRDLGLESRQQLRELLLYNFPEVAGHNVQNMRWKRFFYKQLCERGGSYVCRAPSCEQCSTRDECFGEEH